MRRTGFPRDNYMKVSKFGGSSLADAEQIKKVCTILLSDSERRILVVSAPGKRHSSDIKVTDLLIALASARLADLPWERELTLVLRRFEEIAEALDVKHVMGSIRENLETLTGSDTSHPGKYMDALKAAGEDNCARLVAAYLSSQGHKAEYINPKSAGLLLTSDFGKAHVLPESYGNLSSSLSRVDGICVFPGFFGYSPEGEVVTFSRGGSDITGAILAAAVNAEVYENWTDVDSVYAVNPALIKNPFPISEITYDEMRELSYAGFSVLHEEALYPAYLRGIPVHVRNTNNPKAVGTKIVCRHQNYDSLVTGIAGEKGFCTVNISKYLMNQEIGFLAKVLQIISEEQIAIEHMPSGIDSITIVIRSAEFTAEKERRIVQRISLELQVDVIDVRRDLSIVMIVGEAMAKTVGTTARAAAALSKAGINLEIINQGASEISVMFGVKEEYCNYAVRELYKEFFLK